MVAVAPTTAKAMHITALVERSAKIIWGARQLGEVHHLPEKVDARLRQRLRVPADHSGRPMGRTGDAGPGWASWA